MNKHLYLLCTTCLLTACAKLPTITVTNPTEYDRDNEIVELSPVPELLKSGDVAIFGPNGEEVPYQITYDSILIFPASVKALGSATYTLKDKAPSPADTLVAYTMRPDLQDDFAWENEHSGYRLYGPRFKREGGKVHGYDIWCKRNPAPIVDKLYDDNAAGITYHKDHGEGFDGYTVGPTLGAGGCALLGNDGPCYATAYDNYEVLDQGPLRMTVRFTIDSIDYDGTPVKETRIVSLDRNARMNKVSTLYSEIPDSAWVGAGIVVHTDNVEAYTILDDINGLSVTDLSDDLTANNGEIYIGVIVPGASEISFMPFAKETARAKGQLVAKQKIEKAEPFVYYWGSGWNKRSVNNADEWQQLIQQSYNSIENPLQATLNENL